MKKYICSALILMFAASVSSYAQGGFKPLFDGKTTKGWHSYNKTEVGSAWEVADGALHMNPSKKGTNGGGDLVTDKEFANFHLKYDWKVAPGANSGVIFFVHEDPTLAQTYLSGPEMQVIDNDGHKDGKIEKHRAGDLYDMLKSSTEPVKPVGQWNQAEIIANRGKLTFILNGIKIVETTMWDDNWKNLIANSKFKTWKGFGTFSKGKIALQDHGDEVWYKNIAIKEL